MHALLHGKLAESNPEPQRLEDALTSTVFGAIFWAEDWKLLERWLGIPSPSSQRVPIIEYWFWPRLALAEPDVVFRLGNVLVVVEAKYRSDRHDTVPKPEEVRALAINYSASTGPLLDPYQSVPNMRKQSNVPFVSVNLFSSMLSMRAASSLAASMKNLSCGSPRMRP